MLKSLLLLSRKELALLVPLTLNLGEVGLGMSLGKKLTNLSPSSSSKTSVRSSVTQNKGRKEAVQNSDYVHVTGGLK